MTEWAKWDQESDKHLEEHWKNGMSIDDIAAKMGRTVSSVQSRASRRSLQRQPGDRSRFAPKTADGKVY
jgi:DNA-directed RNA polymerase specialized sigma24 family protein